MLLIATDFRRRQSGDRLAVRGCRSADPIPLVMAAAQPAQLRPGRGRRALGGAARPRFGAASRPLDAARRRDLVLVLGLRPARSGGVAVRRGGHGAGRAPAAAGRGGARARDGPGRPRSADAAAGRRPPHAAARPCTGAAFAGGWHDAGLVAAYYGSWADQTIMRVVDVVFAFPAILLAIAIVAALGPGLGEYDPGDQRSSRFRPLRGSCAAQHCRCAKRSSFRRRGCSARQTDASCRGTCL